MIEQYERAILEWFNAAYPDIREMSYGKAEDVLLAKKAHLVYPCLLYFREDSDWVLSAGFPLKDTNSDGSLVESVFFKVPQVYEATLFLNDEVDLYRVANLIRQKWYKNSYVTLRYPDKDTPLQVGLRLYLFKIETDRNGVDSKGPKRYLRMRWRSDLFLEARHSVARIKGFKITLNANGDRLDLYSCDCVE